MSMKAVVLGNKSIARKLTESLKGIGIELVSLSEMTEVTTLLKQKTFDLALVDIRGFLLNKRAEKL